MNISIMSGLPSPFRSARTLGIDVGDAPSSLMLPLLTFETSSDALPYRNTLTAIGRSLMRQSGTMSILAGMTTVVVVVGCVVVVVGGCVVVVVGGCVVVVVVGCVVVVVGGAVTVIVIEVTPNVSSPALPSLSDETNAPFKAIVWAIAGAVSVKLKVRVTFVEWTISEPESIVLVPAVNVPAVTPKSMPAPVVDEPPTTVTVYRALSPVVRLAGPTIVAVGFGVPVE